MRDIYIIGAGGHGKVVLDIIDKSSKFNAYAFLDDDQNLLDKEINGVKVIGNLNLVFKDNKAAVIAVGNNKIRKKIFKDLSEYTKIDLWRQKSEVLQKMRKTIKVNLIKYDEFKEKYQSITNKIIKLSKNIFMF